MTCPACGYMMSAFETQCPRCKRLPPQPNTQPPPKTQPQPPRLASLGLGPVATAAPEAAAPVPAAVVPAMSARQSPSPLAIAAGVICGILCVIGLLQIIIGGITFTHRNDPIVANRDNIRNTTTVGGYVNPIEEASDDKIAGIESEAVLEQSVTMMLVGCGFCAPLLILAAVTARRKRTTAKTNKAKN